MQYRVLGRSQIAVSEIGYGAWGIGGDWGSKDDAEARRALQRAIDLGVTFFDTAMVYGDGHSEQLIGQVIKGQRDKLVVASKIPPKTYKWPVLPRDRAAETFPSDWIVECTESSLRRLGTDYLDLQQFHAWTPEYLEQTDWKEGIEKLKKQGKIRAWGVSANDWEPYNTVSLVESGLADSIQVIYNIFEQRPAEKLLPAALKHNVGIIVRVPFEEGLLTGKLTPQTQFGADDWRGQWLTPPRLAEAQTRVERLKPLLGPDRPTLAALALKFCLSHPAVSTVIPGMKSAGHVEQNVAVSDARPLPPDVLAALESHKFVHGWSYPWAQK